MPELLQNEPTGQGRQAERPVDAENWPTGQIEHEKAPLAAKYPAEHATQSNDVELRTKPGIHKEQLAGALPEHTLQPGAHAQNEVSKRVLTGRVGTALMFASRSTKITFPKRSKTIARGPDRVATEVAGPSTNPMFPLPAMMDTEKEGLIRRIRVSKTLVTHKFPVVSNAMPPTVIKHCGVVTRPDGVMKRMH